MRRGFVLIATCIALTLLLGLAGLVVDAGRMYVIKSELQAFTDAAALNAALELNGSSEGLVRARDAARSLAHGNHAMRWDMNSKDITEIQVRFGGPGAWEQKPSAVQAVKQVQVEASAPAEVIFLRALGAITGEAPHVAASSSAARDGSGPARLVQ